MDLMICKKCNVEYPYNAENFHHNYRLVNAPYLNKICKICNNSERRARWYTKASHNIPKHCNTCNKMFFKTKADIQRMLRRGYKKSYCSKSCVKGGKSGSWNGKRSGEGNPNCKLTIFDVKQIKKFLIEKLYVRCIAEKFNVSISTINAIKFNRSWKEVNIL